MFEMRREMTTLANITSWVASPVIPAHGGSATYVALDVLMVEKAYLSVAGEGIA
jgi:hypothetical protein